MKLLFGIMTAVAADAPATSMTPSNSSTVLCTKLASASLLVTCHLSLVAAAAATAAAAAAAAAAVAAASWVVVMMRTRTAMMHLTSKETYNDTMMWQTNSSDDVMRKT